MDYLDWFPKRVTQLRVQRGISARDMSLSLGQSESYINKIENKRTLPSMSGFFYICEYLELSPQEFFNVDAPAPHLAKEIAEFASNLTVPQAEHILAVIQDLAKENA